jgi:hypothetical protein
VHALRSKSEEPFQKKKKKIEERDETVRSWLLLITHGLLSILASGEAPTKMKSRRTFDEYGIPTRPPANISADPLFAFDTKSVHK